MEHLVEGKRAITKQSYLRFAHYPTRDGSRVRARERKILHERERGKMAIKRAVTQSLANNILVHVDIIRPRIFYFRVSCRRNQGGGRKMLR